MQIVLDNIYPVFDAIEELGNIATSGYPMPRGTFNCLLNPLGEAYARGWFCLRRDTLNKINLNATHSITFTDDTGRSATAYNLLFVTEPLNLVPGKASDPDAVFLCEMSDLRYQLGGPHMGVAVNKQFNVRAPDYSADATPATNYYADSLNAGAAWTWQTMMANLWATMSTQLGTTPTLPAIPDGTPEGWRFPGVSCWWALNRILEYANVAVLWNPTLQSNPYSLVAIGATDSASDAAITTAETGNLKIFDREYRSVIFGRIPGKARVYFHVQYGRYGEEQTTPRTSSQWATNGVTSIDVTGPDSASDPSVIVPLWGSMAALADKDGAITNTSALTTNASDVANGFWRMIRGRGGLRLHKIFSGVLMNGSTAFVPGSSIRGVAWRQDLNGIGGDEPGGLITEIVRHPFWMLRVDDQAGFCECCDDSTEVQSPDFRPSYPNYPHLLQKVRLTTGTADANGLFTAFVQQYDSTARTWSDKEACYAKEHNGLTTLASGNRYTARLSGYDSTATAAPIYTIGDGGGALTWNVVAVTLAAGTYNNYALTSVTGTLLINATGNVIITGFANGWEGRFLKVESAVASVGTVTLPTESGSSTASNRVHSPSSWDEVISPGGGRSLNYNSSIDNRWCLNFLTEDTAKASSGIPSAASVTGGLAVDTTSTSPSCGALYVYYGAAWHHTAGGGLVSYTANRTALQSDYTQLLKHKTAAGVHTLDFPNTGIDACWHAFHYNEPATSAANSGSLLLTAATVFHGVVFSGGGGFTQADGSGAFYSWGVEQYRTGKTISTSTYTILPSDENLVLVFTNSTGCAVTLPQSANTGNFAAGFRFCVDNKCSAGNVVITPATSTIDGLAAIAVQTRCSVEICADGTNYNVERGWAPTGVTEYSTTPQTITAGWHGRNNVYTGSAAGVFNEPATLPTGMLFGVINAGTGAGTTLAYTRVSGVIDTLRRGDGFILNNVASGDAGTAAFAALGVMRNGGREVSSSGSCTRDDNNRVIAYTGSGGHTQTLYTIDATNQSWDTVYSIFFKNNGTANWTIAAGGADTINGAATLLLGPCQGIHLYAIAAAKWIGVTGVACVQYGTADPTYTAPQGTPYYQTTSHHLWINSSGSTTWTDVTSGQYVGTTVFLTSGGTTATFTTGATTNKIKIRMWGGGGGGGGMKTVASGYGVAGGGGSGGYAEKTFTVTPSTGYTYQVGNGGSGGAGSIPGNGGTGQNSLFTVGGTTVTAFGGVGGTGSTAVSGASIIVTGGGTGAPISTNGDLNCIGMDGQGGAATGCLGVNGSGNFVLEEGSQPGTTSIGNCALNTSAGNGSAGSKGSGGQGASVLAGSATANGGQGGFGVLIIDEYT